MSANEGNLKVREWNQQWNGSGQSLGFVDPNTFIIQSLQRQLAEKDAEVARLRELLALMSLREYAEHEA